MYLGFSIFSFCKGSTSLILRVFLRLVPLIVIVVVAAGAVVVIIDWWDRKTLLAILVVEVLLLTICEDPEAIREIAKVGTDCGRTNLPGRVVAWYPVTILIVIVLNEYKATWCLDVLGNTNEATSLIVNGARICDLLDVSSPTVIDEQLDIGAFNGILHPRDRHQFILAEADPVLLPSIANGEILGIILVGCVLGNHLVAVLGTILVGEGAGHLGTWELRGRNKNIWCLGVSIFSRYCLRSSNKFAAIFSTVVKTLNNICLIRLK
jgi:hypothetical protein